MGWLTDTLFGKAPKAKRVPPLPATAEEEFLLNYLMLQFKTSTSHLGLYNKRMNELYGTKGVPINFGGKQIAEMKPLNTMKTLAQIATEQLEGSLNPALEMYKSMMGARYNTPVATTGGKQGIIPTIAPALIQAGASSLIPGAGQVLGAAWQGLGDLTGTVLGPDVLDALGLSIA